MIRQIATMGPIFLLAIIGWALTQADNTFLRILGYIIVALQFVIIFGTMIILKTPSLDELDRKIWINMTIKQKIAWKINKWILSIKKLIKK